MCYHCFSCEAQRAAARKGHPDDVVLGLRRKPDSATSKSKY